MGREPCGTQVGSVGCGAADLFGEVGDQVGAGLQVPTPVGVVGEALGNAGEPRQRTGHVGLGESVVEDGGPVGGGVDLPHRDRGGEALDRVVAVGVQQQQVAAQRGPRRFVGQAGGDLLGRGVEAFDELGAGEVVGGDVQGVVVAGGGLAEPQGGIVLIGLLGGGGAGGTVAGQDRFKAVGRGSRVDEFGPDHAVRVAVADDLQVEVVGVPAAGRHRVQLLPRLVADSGDRAWCRR